MKKQIIETKEKIVEKILLQEILGQTVEEIKIIGHELDGYINGYNSYGTVFFKIREKKNTAIVFNVHCDRLVLGDDVIIIEIDESDYDKYDDYPHLYYKPQTPFVISKIDILGQKAHFQFEGDDIKHGWFKDGNIPGAIDYTIDNEDAIMLISTDGRRIFIAHDTSPRFEIATSETHIQHILSAKYGSENGYFQLQRVIE